MKDIVNKYATEDGLPFSQLLPEKMVETVIHDSNIQFRDRIFNPAVTLWSFLSQILDDDRSCRKAVARVVAHRTFQNKTECSANTGGYCLARKKLPLSVVKQLSKQASSIESESDWKWHNRTVKIVDGSTVSMPDTEANQKAFPQLNVQKEGLGFPIARIAAIFSLETGMILDVGIAPYQGKNTGETSLFKSMIESFDENDVMLADRLYDSYSVISTAVNRNVDVVIRTKRKFKEDEEIRFIEDKFNRPSTPIKVRLVKSRVTVSGKEQELRILTTIFDLPPEEIADLYIQRWHAELDLRNVKQTLGMDILSCKSPEMIEKELWMYILGYNLIRQIIVDSATYVGNIKPRQISFRGAMQSIDAFMPYLEIASEKMRYQLVHRLLKTIASHKVGRTGRAEPRVVKRRKQSLPYMMKPRHILKMEMGGN